MTDVRTDHPSKFTVHALTTQPQTLSLQHPSLLVLFVVEEPYCGLRLIEYNNHENYNYCRLNCWGICLWYVIYVGGDVMFKVNIRCHVVNWRGWMLVDDTAGDMITNGGSFIGLSVLLSVTGATIEYISWVFGTNCLWQSLGVLRFGQAPLIWIQRLGISLHSLFYINLKEHFVPFSLQKIIYK